jgi:cysteine sulfinate desulfinase/cysteine desulfurase-like protein
MRHAINSAVSFYNAGVVTRDRRIGSRTSFRESLTPSHDNIYIHIVHYVTSNAGENKTVIKSCFARQQSNRKKQHIILSHHKVMYHSYQGG